MVCKNSFHKDWLRRKTRMCVGDPMLVLVLRILNKSWILQRVKMIRVWILLLIVIQSRADSWFWWGDWFYEVIGCCWALQQHVLFIYHGLWHISFRHVYSTYLKWDSLSNMCEYHIMLHREQNESSASSFFFSNYKHLSHEPHVSIAFCVSKKRKEIKKKSENLGGLRTSFHILQNLLKTVYLDHMPFFLYCIWFLEYSFSGFNLKL